MLTGNNSGCRADFMVVKDDGRTLLGCETADILNLLHIGRFQANNVDGAGLESCIRVEIQGLVDLCWSLEGMRAKTPYR